MEGWSLVGGAWQEEPGRRSCSCSTSDTSQLDAGSVCWTPENDQNQNRSTNRFLRMKITGVKTCCCPGL